MDLLEIKKQERLPREEVPKRLHALADNLARHNQLELSTKCRPDEAFQAAAESCAFLSQRGGPVRRAGDEDPARARVLRGSPPRVT
jgi:hypothetical protein